MHGSIVEVVVVEDRDLVRLCAERVMSFELHHHEADAPHGGYLLTEDGRVWRVHREGDAVRMIEWNPLRSDLHAAQLVDRVAGLHKCAVLHCLPGDRTDVVWLCSFPSDEQMLKARRFWPWAMHHDRRRAWVLACLRALGIEAW